VALPLYAKNLIALLREVGGWQQQQLANHLDVTPGLVSMWATGRQPVPRRHFLKLLALVFDVIREHATQHHDELIGFIDAWILEMFVHIGELAQQIRHYLDVLQGPSTKLDPLVVPIEKRKELRDAASRLVDLFDYIQAYERSPHMRINEYLTMQGSPEEILRRVGRDFAPEFFPEEEWLRMPKGPVVYDKVVGIRLTSEDVDKLDALATQTFRQRPDVMRCLIDMACATGQRDLTLKDRLPPEAEEYAHMAEKGKVDVVAG
jgi:transcriptional regulator with XRE-family HTH domain